MTHLIFFGPCGVGKGTQSQVIARQLRCVHISAGDLLRKHIKEGTEIGKEIKDIIDRGSLAGDELVAKVMIERIKEVETQVLDENNWRVLGWVLDGFPRTIGQAEILAQEGWDHVVINMQAPEEALVERLSERRVCPDCGKNYHLKFNLPPEENTCECGATLIQRPDDAPEVIKDRLQVYQNETLPLLEWFREHDYVVEDIDASGEIDAIRRDIVDRVVPSDSILQFPIAECEVYEGPWPGGRGKVKN